MLEEGCDALREEVRMLEEALSSNMAIHCVTQTGELSDSCQTTSVITSPKISF